MAMTMIMMNFALRQMLSFFWTFFVIHKHRDWTKLKAKFCNSAIEWLNDLHPGSGVGRQGEDVGLQVKPRRFVVSEMVWQLKGVLYLALSFDSSPWFISEQDLSSFFSLDPGVLIILLTSPGCTDIYSVLVAFWKKNIQGVHYVPKQPEPPGNW